MLDSDSLRLGLGLLAAGGPTTDPNRTGIGQRLQEGLGSFDAYKQNALKQKMLEAQMQEHLQAQQQAKAMRALAAKFAIPGKPALAPLIRLHSKKQIAHVSRLFSRAWGNSLSLDSRHLRH